MKTERRHEQGQVLVLVAVAAAAIFGMLALVLDIGNALTQRRYVQNAADASSFAAARYLAYNRGTGTEAGVMAELNSYLPPNGNATLAAPSGPNDGAWYIQLDGSTVGPVGAGTGVPSTAAGVRVNATKTFPTFFARVLGYSNLTVTARADAIYGTANQVYLDWSRTGTMVMPMAFDIEAYQRSIGSPCNRGYGSPFNFSLYIDTPTDCASGSPDTHFSFSTLNIGNDCSNNTTKTVLDTLLNDPESLGDTYIEPGVTPIQICHGARATTWDQIPLNTPFLVPVISHAAAMSCNPSCWTPVINFVYMVKTGMGGAGINTYLTGYWADPRLQKPLTGTGVSTISRTVEGPVSFALSY